MHSAPGLAVPLRIVLAAEERRSIVRRLDAYGVSGQRIQAIFGTGHSTFARDIGPRPRPKPHTKRSVLEAGLAFQARYLTRPTTVAWNSALSMSDPDTYARWLAGYHPVATPDEWRPWPLEKEVLRFFESFPRYIAALRAETERRRLAHDPYEPVPLALQHEFHCQLAGFMPRLPPHMVCYVDGFTYRVRDFKVLLGLVGGEVAYKIIEWLDETAPPPIPGPRWFEAPIPLLPLGRFCLPNRPTPPNM